LTGRLDNGKQSDVNFNISIVPDPSISALMSSLFKRSSIKNKTVKNDLFARIKSISTKGVVKLVFSKPLMQPGNYSVIEERKVIQFQIVSRETLKNDMPKIIGWKILEFGLSSLNVKIEIDRPEKISSLSVRIF
jgi:hypothetical protein